MAPRNPYAPACRGCYHFRGYYEGNEHCNYIFDVGHRRPCPPGADCTVRKPRRKGGASDKAKTSKKVEKTLQKQEDL